VSHFEVFTKALVPLKRDPTITIQKNGAISLNKAAQVALGAPDAVELLYDPTTRTVGLRGVDVDADHAYAVRSSRGNGLSPFVISAMAFLHFYDIDVAVSRRWSAYLYDGVLCIDLDDESVPVTSNRARKTDFSGEHPEPAE
jgi:hypothetical protein